MLVFYSFLRDNWQYFGNQHRFNQNVTKLTYISNIRVKREHLEAKLELKDKSEELEHTIIIEENQKSRSIIN